jgi:hypothetical protein
MSCKVKVLLVIKLGPCYKDVWMSNSRALVDLNFLHYMWVSGQLCPSGFEGKYFKLLHGIVLFEKLVVTDFFKKFTEI